jgi:hypothetical protein
MPDDPAARNLEEAAVLYDEAAEELTLAAQHSARAAEHFRNREVPRGTAHAWAALGHIRGAEDRLDEQARMHATKSSV